MPRISDTVIAVILGAVLCIAALGIVAACTEADKTTSGNPMPMASRMLVDEAVKNLRVVQDPASGLCFAVTGVVTSGSSPPIPVLQVLAVPCKAER